MQEEYQTPQYIQEEDEIDLKELFLVLKNNKMLLALITFIVTLSASIFVYFKPISYESYTILDIHTDTKQKAPTILGDFTGLNKDEIDKILALSKMFSVNKEVIEKVDFSIQYFEKKFLKQIELYDDKPIVIQDVDIKSNLFAGKKFIFSPVDDKHYQLQIGENYFFKKPVVKKVFAYNEMAQGEGFEFNVTKNSDFTHNCIVRFNGSSRDIYEHIIKQNLSLTRLGNDLSIIKISFRDTISKRARAYIDTLAQLLEQENIMEKFQENKTITSSIDLQLLNVKKVLSQSEKKLQEFKTKQNIEVFKSQSQKLVEKISQIDTKLEQTKLKLSAIEMFQDDVQTSHIDNITLSLSSLGDANVDSLFSELKTTKQRLRDLKLNFTEEHPVVISLNNNLQTITDKLNQNLQALSTMLRQRIQILTQQKETSQNLLASYPKKEKQLVEYKRDFEVYSTLYSTLLEQKVEKDLAKSSIKSDFKIVDVAFTDPSTKKPKSTLILIVGFITGLILGVFIVFFKEFLKNSLYKEGEFETLGIIPHFKHESTYTAVLDHPESKFTESFRRIRNKMKMKIQPEGSIYLFTSEHDNEGKTTVALNLTSIFSIADYRTIFINLDFKNPMTHRNFTIDNTHGISSYLQGDASMEDVIFPTRYDNLDIISSGFPVKNSAELLLSPRLKNLLTSLKEHYDVIVLDTPPLTSVSDTLEVLSLADMVTFVAKESEYDETKKSYFNQIIKQHKLKSSSLILNQVKHTIFNSFYKNNVQEKEFKGFSRLLDDLKKPSSKRKFNKTE